MMNLYIAYLHGGDHLFKATVCCVFLEMEPLMLIVCFCRPGREKREEKLCVAFVIDPQDGVGSLT